MSENLSDEWQPATVEEVRVIIKEDLAMCDPEQVAAFEKYSVDPYPAPIVRYGKLESVIVVARRGAEVIYWEDAEYGFQVSPVSSDGHILEHWCNQDELCFALNAWIDGRERAPNFGPARPLD